MKNDELLYLENQICFPLYAASRLTTKLYAPLLNELDLTYPQYLVLLVLWQQDFRTVGEISNLLYLESNTLTPLLKRLEQKQLLHRKRSETDERSVIISLSEEGRQLKEKALCIPEKIIASFSDQSMNVAEVIQFQQTLLKLVAILEQKLQPTGA